MVKLRAKRKQVGRSRDAIQKDIYQNRRDAGRYLLAFQDANIIFNELDILLDYELEPSEGKKQSLLKHFKVNYVDWYGEIKNPNNKAEMEKAIRLLRIQVKEVCDVYNARANIITHFIVMDRQELFAQLDYFRTQNCIAYSGYQAIESIQEIVRTTGTDTVIHYDFVIVDIPIEIGNFKSPHRIYPAFSLEYLDKDGGNYSLDYAAIRRKYYPLDEEKFAILDNKNAAEIYSLYITNIRKELYEMNIFLNHEKSCKMYHNNLTQHELFVDLCATSYNRYVLNKSVPCTCNSIAYTDLLCQIFMYHEYFASIFANPDPKKWPKTPADSLFVSNGKKVRFIDIKDSFATNSYNGKLN
jgi:hypothetical protein